MSRDEEGLRWEGDDELDGLSVDGEADAADGAEPGEADASDGVAAGTASVAEARPPRGPLGWLTLLLALASTAGWIVILVANPVQQPSLLGLALYQLGELLAVIAPLLWWWLVDRVAPVKQRAPWWLAGLVVTAPWPLVAGVFA